MNPITRTGFLVSAALAVAVSGCGAPPEADEGLTGPAPATVSARRPRLIDVNGRTVNRLAPDKLRTLVEGLRADGRTKDSDKLASIFRADTGELRDPETVVASPL